MSTSNTTQKYNEDQLWTDVETGGLADMTTLPTGERVYGALHHPLLEVGILLPRQFDNGIISLNNSVCPSFNLGIKVTEEMLTRFDPWALKQHTKSGLLERLKTGEGFDYFAEDNLDAEAAILDFLHSNNVKEFNREEGTGAIALGNNISFDMQFFDAQLPRVRAYMHYRKADVSSINVMARTRLWKHVQLNGVDKALNHTALEDIRESVLEMNAYTSQINNLLWYKQQANELGIVSDMDKCLSDA
ncbi:3'-5' exonuclease family protein [Vibrio penaeicida]|uniref:Oligoribonuclease n=1 Tax=Vibrio penaeicida TaxID=104609 RepID=A0AAV5NK66_9VIBR|nr:exonuclease domain-containing protein [Vibrio penaeicida]RTZ23034.1 hypothetical protein EKN09_11160 [Vibrio penaeicida]GLQ71035.1 oligoribonuclease [Vibrio penaeicida]